MTRTAISGEGQGESGASADADRAFVPSASSPQAVSPVPASIPSVEHTPGPWEHETDDRYGSVYGTDAEGRDWQICDLGPPIDLICNSAEDVAQHIRDQADANARLISAAPELLEALEDLRRINRKGIKGREAANAWGRANAAIKKARGQ